MHNYLKTHQTNYTLNNLLKIYLVKINYKH